MAESENLIERVKEFLQLKYRDRPNYHLGMAIALVSTVSTTNVRTDDTTPHRTRAHVFVCLLGPSNSGKTSVIRCGIDLLQDIGYSNFLTNDITPEDFVPYLKTHKFALMTISEFSSLLSSYKTRGYMSGLREKLINVYDIAPLVQGRTTRGHTEVSEYAMIAIGDTQPDVLRLYTTVDDIASGFLPRFIWFVEENVRPTPPKVLDSEGLQLQQDVTKWLGILYRFSKTHTIKFRFTQSQVDAIFELSQRYTSDQPLYEPFYARIVQMVYKLAMVREFASLSFCEAIKQRPGAVEEDEDTSNEGDDWLAKSASGSDGVPTEIGRKALRDFKVDMSNDSVNWALDFVQNYTKGALGFTIRTLSISDADKIREIVKHYCNELEHEWMPETILLRRSTSIHKDPTYIQKSLDFTVKAGYIDRRRTHAGISYRFVTDEEMAKREDSQSKDKEDGEDKSSEPIHVVEPASNEDNYEDVGT